MKRVPSFLRGAKRRCADTVQGQVSCQWLSQKKTLVSLCQETSGFFFLCNLGKCKQKWSSRFGYKNHDRANWGQPSVGRSGWRLEPKPMFPKKNFFSTLSQEVNTSFCSFPQQHLVQNKFGRICLQMFQKSLMSVPAMNPQLIPAELFHDDSALKSQEEDFQALSKMQLPVREILSSKHDEHDRMFSAWNNGDRQSNQTRKKLPLFSQNHTEGNMFHLHELHDYICQINKQLWWSEAY